jgi:hypothetical protein
MMEETSHSVWVNTLALKAAGGKKHLVNYSVNYLLYYILNPVLIDNR